MIESSDKLARFVGLDAYVEAGGSTRADLFGEEVYLDKPALLNKLAEQKLSGIRKELEAEGWAWVEINPERDYDAIHRCGRIKPQLIGVPAELVDLKTQLDSELDEIEQALDDTESDALIEARDSVQERLDEAEKQLAGYVGFDSTQKALAGCFVSIGPDGILHVDKGLVRPEHRKMLAKLLGTEDDKPVKAKSKHALPESLRRDLAADRLEVAQIAIARNPEIALDLLTFQAASALLGEEPVLDGPDVKFQRPRPGKERDTSTALRENAEIGRTLPISWLKATSESDQLEAFRSLPREDRLRLLAYCIAITLRPNFGPVAGEEATAYDAALALTATSMVDYWRPSKDNFFNRVTRGQLLEIGREVLGEVWAKSHVTEKKGSLVNQFDRLFSDPERSGRSPDQIEKLKRWLPAGMSFDLADSPKPVKSKKAGKAA
jgi:ParB family chromosome partitioning protein